MGPSKESRLCGSRAGRLEHLIFNQRCILNSMSARRGVTQPPLLVFSVLLDHLIRPRQHVGRNRQADLLGRFQIDDELELCRLLHRQVGGLGSF
jgi:hypothetical protein